MTTALISVVTITEAARLWNKHYTSVRRARDSKRNPLVFRYADRSCLITVESLIQRWGQPQIPLTSLLY